MFENITRSSSADYISRQTIADSNKSSALSHEKRIESDLNDIFELMKSNPAERAELLEKVVLEYVHNQVFTVFRVFCKMVPFELFLEMILSETNDQIIEHSLNCLSCTCSIAQIVFPCETFAREDVLQLLIHTLSSEKPELIKHSLVLLTQIVSKNQFSRDFVLNSGVIDILAQIDIDYSFVELLEALSLTKFPEEFEGISLILEILYRVLRAERSVDIYSISLSSLKMIIINGGIQVLPEAFLPFIEKFIFSNITGLMVHSLSILEYSETAPISIGAKLYEILYDEDRPPVVGFTAKLFVRFHIEWGCIVDENFVNTLIHKLGLFSLQVEIALIRAIMVFSDSGRLIDVENIGVFLNYVTIPEISKECLVGFCNLYQKHVQSLPSNTITNLSTQFESLLESIYDIDNEEISNMAEAISRILEH